MQTVAKLQEALPRARNADGAEGLRRLAGRCGWLHREAVSFKAPYRTYTRLLAETHGPGVSTASGTLAAGRA